MWVQYEFYVRVLSGSPIPETEPNDGCSASAALQRLEGRVIGPATAKTGASPSRSTGTIGVVAVHLERGVPVWNLIAGTGVLHRLLHHDIVTRRGRGRSRNQLTGPE